MRRSVNLCLEHYADLIAVQKFELEMQTVYACNHAPGRR